MEEEYPEEMFEGCEQSDIQKLKEKLALIKTEENFLIEDNKNYYLGGIKYLFYLVKKLRKDEGIKFWEQFNISDLISELNNVNTLTKLVSKTVFNLEVDVEMVHLIVKDYYKRITTRINKNR